MSGADRLHEAQQGYAAAFAEGGSLFAREWRAQRRLLPGEVAAVQADAARVLAAELQRALLEPEAQGDAVSAAVRMGVALAVADRLRRPASIRALFGERGSGPDWLRVLAQEDPVRVAGAATRTQWAEAVVEPDAAREHESWERCHARDERLVVLLDAALAPRTVRRRRR